MVGMARDREVSESLAEVMSITRLLAGAVDRLGQALMRQAAPQPPETPLPALFGDDDQDGDEDERHGL